MRKNILLITAIMAALAAVCAGVVRAGKTDVDESTDSAKVVVLDPAKFNKPAKEEPQQPQDFKEMLKESADDTLSLVGGDDKTKKRVAWGGGIGLLLLLVFVLPRAIRPNLEGCGPATVMIKLGRFFARFWDDTELQKLAWACTQQNALNRELVKRMSVKQLHEFLNFLYIANNFSLFAEAVFFRRDMFEIASEFTTGLSYGELAWAQIKRLPLKTLERVLVTFRNENEDMLAFQTANAFARQLILSQDREKAVNLLKSIPLPKLHKTTWDLFFEINELQNLPPQYFEAIPRYMLASAATKLIDEGHSQLAKSIMERNPRDKWSDADYLAYFALQLEVDTTLANEFYDVLSRNVDIARNTELHYEAAKRCEQKGHADIAVTIYRKFVAEGINFKDAISRYNILHQNLSLETRNYTIMMTDIQGYTEKTSKETPSFMMEYLKKHNDILAPLIRRFKGKIVKTIGDAFLAVFDSPTNAVTCGLEIQNALTRYNAGKSENDAIYVRVALNTGEVSLAADGDVYGDAVNITARMESVAQAGEVWLTESLAASLSGKDSTCAPVGFHAFKGVGREIMVYKAVPKGAPIPQE